MTDSDKIAAFIAQRGVTRASVGESTLLRRLDTRHTPAETRAENSAVRSRFGTCEDAPCCGCCDPRIGLVRGVVR